MSSDIFVTEELARPPSRAIDHASGKRALLELSARMADRPDEVLPRFVELARELTGGTSAGLSLYEAEPAPGVFRWKHLVGVLACFERATTPRHHSPCGVTLDRAEPVLARHPERIYDWIADAGIVVPEVLLVPLYLADPTPLGTLWIVADQEGHFDAAHADIAVELAGFSGRALRLVHEREQLKAALAAQEALAREMSHRVKNVLSVADSMVRFAAHSPGDKAEMAHALSGRLQALAQAHAMVRPDAEKGESIARTPDLRSLVEAVVVAPHEHDADTAARRFTLAGPQVPLGMHAAGNLALVLHELATNAAKHGALADYAGRVAITWQIEDQQLVLRWQEMDGPAIAGPPAHEGFGDRLIRATVTGTLGGTLRRDWHGTGLVATITAATERLGT